jgi:formamidopyrimidine-DNA glycosylase
MPELPEVETIKRGLEKKIVGLTIKSVEVLTSKSFQADPDKIIAKKIIGITRRAKILVIKFRDNYLLVHLKMTGQLLLDKLPNKYTRVIIEFSDNTRLYFNDLRKFGWMKIVKNLDGLNLGPEPLGKEFTFEYFKKLLKKTRRAIKIIIMDQQNLSGVGNIYATEALFDARVYPGKPANTLTDAEILRLRESIIKVLKMGIVNLGSSSKDEAFRDIEGKKGSMQKHFAVYEREGLNCLECKGKIKKIKLGGRGTYFCPICQKQ